MATNEFLYLDEDDVEEEEEEEDNESDEENEGYNYTFVDPGPSDDQRCPICHFVARKACQTNCCGKIFCKGCLEKHRQYSDEFKCPICRKKLGKRYFKDTRIEREILHLQIYCTNKNEGCSWQGNLKDIDTHIKECPNQVIKCPFNDIGCEIETKREMMDKHMETNTQAHLQNAVKKITYLQNAVEKNREQKCPLVITFSNYSKHKRDGDQWLSSGFYTSPGGYKLRLKLFANGVQNGKDTHLTCAINLMPGEHDDILDWPFQGEVTVELLNQLEDKNHCKQVICFNDNTFDECKKRKKKEDTNGWGAPQFISHTDLGLNSSTNTQYLMNDTLYFRVSVNVHSKTKPWLASII